MSQPDSTVDHRAWAQEIHRESKREKCWHCHQEGSASTTLRAVTDVTSTATTMSDRLSGVSLKQPVTDPVQVSRIVVDYGYGRNQWIAGELCIRNNFHTQIYFLNGLSVIVVLWLSTYEKTAFYNHLYEDRRKPMRGGKVPTRKIKKRVDFKNSDKAANLIGTGVEFWPSNAALWTDRRLRNRSD